MKDKHGNPLIVGQRALVSVVVTALPTLPDGPLVVRIGDHETTNGTHLSVYSKDLQSGIHGAPAEGAARTGPATEVRKRTHVGLGEQDVLVPSGYGQPRNSGKPDEGPITEPSDDAKKQAESGLLPTGVKPLVDGENRPLNPSPSQDAVGSEATPHTSPDGPSAPPAPGHQG
jgi:hypothetical protein